MKNRLISFVAFTILTAPLWAATSVPLILQEAVYPGSVTGVARQNEPFCMGVPVADSAQIPGQSTSTLGLTGASAGQFRVLARWPDGYAKWIETCGILPSLSAGAVSTAVSLTDTGAGNFGGSDLAVLANGTITVTTGAATFGIKAGPGFNGIDSAVVGGTTVVATGTSTGFVITGPTTYPATTCASGCATEYTSLNDTGSTCIIEKNGPVQAVLKCDWDYKNGAGNKYLSGTARMYFYKAKTSVKITASLRNADYGTSAQFASAFKLFQGYEFRTGVNISGTTNYSIATHAGTPSTGTLSGSDSIYIYQGRSSSLLDGHYCGVQGCSQYTTDNGYRINKNGSDLSTGRFDQYPQGWADLSDGSGVGMEIGKYQFSAYGPNSLKFTAGGTVATIGILALENSGVATAAWPAHKIDDLYLNFHASFLASPQNEFLKFQHYLVGRADWATYNSTGVLPYKLIDPAAEDAYYTATVNAAQPKIATNRGCCIQDLGVNGTWPLRVRWGYDYNEGGATQQMEWRYSWLTNFITRGMTGRWLDVAHFEKMQAELGFPRSDGFNWRDKTSADINSHGEPGTNKIVPTNLNNAFRVWPDEEHNHWWGILYYYFMSGDETIHDAIQEEKDWYLNFDTNQSGKIGNSSSYFPSGTVNTSGTAVTKASGDNFTAWMVGQPIAIGSAVYLVASVTSGTALVLTSSAGTQTRSSWRVSGGSGNTRSTGVQLTTAAMFYHFLQDLQDPDAPTVLQQGENLFKMQVKPDLCVSGYPSACDPGTLVGGPWNTQGISRVRGTHFGAVGAGGVDPYCGISVGGAGWGYRAQGVFQDSILIQGIMDLRSAEGSGWPDYTLAGDLAYGNSQWVATEGFVYDGTYTWSNNGGRYYVLIDHSNDSCDTVIYPPRVLATTWWPFLTINQLTGTINDWRPKAEIAMQKGWASTGIGYGSFPDYGGYQIAQLIDAIQHPSPTTLRNVTITSFSESPSGTYNLAWTRPPGTTGYRVKWGTKQIVDWIGFNSVTNAFIGNPSTTQNWFAATEAPGVNAGASSTVIATGIGGLTAANFSVKAYATSTTILSDPASLVSVSGNGQSGQAGQPLANLLTVKATDAKGAAVPGARVTFTVTGGGGTVSPAQVDTDNLGLAAARLTLGSAIAMNTVVAASGTLAGSPITFTATTLAAGSGPASKLVLVSGDGQTGIIGQQLANPLTVLVADAKGKAVPGISVTFSVTAGGGTITPAQVSSNAQGQASAVWTLGSAAGPNAVTATSGTLSGSPTTFTATAITSGSGITWIKQTRTSGWPGYAGYLFLSPDPVSQQTIYYGVNPASNNIYSSDLYFYRSDSNIWTHQGGTGAVGDLCSADTPTQPGERHPYGQMAIDTTRNWLWLSGGANQTCRAANVTVAGTSVTGISSSFTGNWGGAAATVGGKACGTIAAITDSNHLTLSSDSCTQGATTIQLSDPGNRHPRLDMYYMTLTANPTANVWHRVFPAHFPPYMIASIVYDPDNDLLLRYGYDGGSDTHTTWVYCRTAENPIPGILTAAQSAAGCNVNGPDDWSEVAVKIVGAGRPASSYPGLVYDTVTKKVILFGGDSGGVRQNRTWAYDVPTRTWTQKALNTTPPPLNTALVAIPALAYNTATHKLLYHALEGPADYEYDPVADTWTRLASNGGMTLDPTALTSTPPQVLAYDASRNALVGFNQAPHDYHAEVWLGMLPSGSAGTISTCDLNGDGVVNLVDVQLAVNQALGTTPCGTADLMGRGVCSVVGVQRIINASRGGDCRTGQ